MTLFNATPKGIARSPVTDEKTPQTAITERAEQVPETTEKTAETAFVSEADEAESTVEIKETTVTESETTPTETELITEEKTIAVQKTPTEECIEITEEVIITESEEEIVECIDKGDQTLAEYKPQIGGQPNLFENDIPTEIDDRPVEDYIGEGQDRPAKAFTSEQSNKAELCSALLCLRFIFMKGIEELMPISTKGTEEPSK